MQGAATVSWEPELTMMPVKRGKVLISYQKDHHFESLDTAVRFVMERLPVSVRSTATIQINAASIPYVDIVRRYARMGPGTPPVALC